MFELAGHVLRHRQLHARTGNGALELGSLLLALLTRTREVLAPVGRLARRLATKLELLVLR